MERNEWEMCVCVEGGGGATMLSERVSIRCVCSVRVITLREVSSV